MLSAEAAADTAAQAFRRGSLTAKSLAVYERRWRSELALDLKLGTLFRRLFTRMLDQDVDDLFRALTSGDLLSRLTQRVSFDWHRDVILFFLKHPALARILLRRCLGRSGEPTGGAMPQLADLRPSAGRRAWTRGRRRQSKSSSGA
jgi:flavin-dependent dehydrogenase